jgi:hypothetical protein
LLSLLPLAPPSGAVNSYLELRARGLTPGRDAGSDFDAEGYDGCVRRVTINQKPKPELTNPAAR